MEEKIVFKEWKEENSIEQLNSGYINLVFAEWCRDNGWFVISHNEGRDSIWVNNQDQTKPIVELYNLFRSLKKY